MLAGRMPSPGLDLKPLRGLEGQGMFAVCPKKPLFLNGIFMSCRRLLLLRAIIVPRYLHTIMTLTSPFGPLT